MTNETALTVMSLDETMSLGEVLYKSGYFDDTKSQAQAVVKILFGRELGIGPVESMMSINIIQGKPAPSSNLIAARVKSHPRYDYRVKQADESACILEWFENGERVGESSFTMAEAKRTKYYEKGSWKILAEKWNWQNYPSDMLFARALTRGHRRYAPDLAGGAPLYVPEELGAEVDEEGDVIDVTPTVAKPQTAPKSDNGGRVPDSVVDDSAQITSPKDLYDAIQELDYYHSIPHMLNTLKKVLGDGTKWPTNDPAWYADAQQHLTEYAMANKAQAAIKETAEQMEAPF